ncbi:MAG: hypothetical protein EOL95_11820 [Bacteroidia bacterium]|nr:hypothetical protein [Bacteroidia bacterium]
MSNLKLNIMPEITLDLALSIEIDNELLLKEVSDHNSYEFEDDQVHDWAESWFDWNNEIIRGK